MESINADQVDVGFDITDELGITVGARNIDADNLELEIDTDQVDSTVDLVDISIDIGG